MSDPNQDEIQELCWLLAMSANNSDSFGVQVVVWEALRRGLLQQVLDEPDLNGLALKNHAFMLWFQAAYPNLFLSPDNSNIGIQPA